MMPKLDGIEVCRRLKGDPALPFMPIVLVTAKSDSQDVVDGLDAGADEYLTKPIDQKTLVARVKALLRLKALHESKAAEMAAASAKPVEAEKPAGTDLFLSYSRLDRPKIEALSEMLQQNGWTVWWDRQIKTGTSYDKVIENALMNARAVVVAWSSTSVDSDWVRAEAAYALKKTKLLPIRLDDAMPPLRFTHIHSINFTKWDGSSGDQAWQRLIADLVDLIGEPAGK
jgi:TIR domain-containing protein/response regulator receiver domain-containing protein